MIDEAKENNYHHYLSALMSNIESEVEDNVTRANWNNKYIFFLWICYLPNQYLFEFLRFPHSLNYHLIRYIFDSNQTQPFINGKITRPGPVGVMTTINITIIVCFTIFFALSLLTDVAEPSP